MDGLVAAKKNELLNKGLITERIQQFLQFEADESHVGDQCQVCLEEVEVGRLMKQLDCGGRHSFCIGCIDQWLQITKLVLSADMFLCDYKAHKNLINKNNKGY